MQRLINPFDHNHFVGYVSSVAPGLVKAHFPSSILLKSFHYAGDQNIPGMVGTFVAIEGETYGFIAQIVEVTLPEKERVELNEQSFHQKDLHPIGKLEVLLCFDFFKREVKKGLNQQPTVGSKIFACSGDIFGNFFQSIGVKENDPVKPALFDIGILSSDQKTRIKISSQSLLSRHCAIVGTTGGGKSFTVAKLLEELMAKDGKAILIDATGEYQPFQTHSQVQSVSFPDSLFFHYSNLTTGDLFLLLRPAGQVQAPKLLDAIKSLKLVKVLQANPNPAAITINNGLLIKNGQLKAPYLTACQTHLATIEADNADFDISRLSDQIISECIYESGFNNLTTWGGIDQRAYDNCTSLIMRTSALIGNSSFRDCLGFSKQKTDHGELGSIINTFLSNRDKKLLRISLENVNFDFQLREILVNAIGKFLLNKARRKEFYVNPIVLFIDEAHQFINKGVKDEFFQFVSLDAFDLIAKECRKHGLFLVLSTQIPRDIPIGTLSQIGTFVTHRLINLKDKEVVANACQEANKSALSFLPILSEGEAIIMGVDLPMPIILKIDQPSIKPKSGTPLIIREKQ